MEFKLPSSGCLVVSVSGTVSALVGKQWTVGSEMNCLVMAPRVSIWGASSYSHCFLYLGTMEMYNMKRHERQRLGPEALIVKPTH